MRPSGGTGMTEVDKVISVWSLGFALPAGVQRDVWCERGPAEGLWASELVARQGQACPPPHDLSCPLTAFSPCPFPCRGDRRPRQQCVLAGAGQGLRTAAGDRWG